MSKIKLLKPIRMGLSALLIVCLLVVLFPLAVSGDELLVTRSLPDIVEPGETFEVEVSFEAPADNFKSLGIHDIAPTAPSDWLVEANVDWCDPEAFTAVGDSSDNIGEYSWMGPYDEGEDFTAVYEVTVPGDAPAGVYDFPVGDDSMAWLTYYIGTSSYKAAIAGDYQVEILPHYNLTLSSSVGGEVNKPGEGVFSYLAGTEVSLKAVADDGYDFYKWMGGLCTVGDEYDATTTVLMDSDYVISANFTPEPPYLEVDKYAAPSTIGQEGSGLAPEESTITLTVTGEGVGGDATAPLDVMINIDCSGSMDWNDPSGLRKDGAKEFVDKLNSSRDQAGVVGYDGSVQLELGLTNDFDAVKDKIDECGNWGGTNFNNPLYRSIELLDAGKQSGSIPIIVFLSDGESATYTYYASDGPAKDAADKGYVIYSIGLGSADDTPLRDMSDNTGGAYFYAATAEDIADVFDEIAGEISGVAGTSVMVTDVLQDYINLEDNFTIEPDCITENADGTTTLEWSLGVIGIDEEWTVEFDVSSDRCGRVLANVVDESMVAYNPVISFEGGFAYSEQAEEVLFPETYLNVRCEEEEEPCVGVPSGPAQISIQSIYVDPEEGTQNWPFEVWVSVGNSGESRGTKTVSLYVNGALEQSQTVGVGGGGGENVLFTVSRAVPGTYTVSVEGREAQFTVLGMGPPQAAPAPPMASAGFGGGLGTGGVIAIIVIVVALVVGLIVILRREPA